MMMQGADRLHSMNRGILYALGAYFLWGVLPVYWKALKHVPAMQILSYRVIWSVFFLMLLLALMKEMGRLKAALLTPGRLPVVLLAAGLLAINWLTYIWGVNAGFIVETSLGYFINPLVSVLMGVIFLRERLRPAQWVPVGLATVGVLYLTFSYGRLPWISLVLAFSFGFYGLVKKTVPLEARYGLTLETVVMFFPALLFLMFASYQGDGYFVGYGASTTILLIGTGLVTALPLLLFGMSAQLIPLTAIGILQYLAPTMQFLIGVFVYNEPFTIERLIGFCIIWLALIVYTVESLLARRRALSTG